MLLVDVAALTLDVAGWGLRRRPGRRTVRRGCHMPRLRDLISRLRRRVDPEKVAARNEALARVRDVRSDVEQKNSTGINGVFGPQMGGGGF